MRRRQSDHRCGGYYVALFLGWAVGLAEESGVLDPFAPKPDEAPLTEDEMAAKLRKDVKMMGLIFGTEFCIAQAHRKAAFDEIAKQKKYARIGGVQNNLAILALQNIRKADEFLEREQKLLKAEFKKVKPLPCSTKPVKELMPVIVSCKGDDPPSECQDPRIQLLLSFIETIDDADDNNE